MIFLLLQAVGDGIRIDSGVALGIAGTVLTALTGALGVLWRQSVTEGKRKDELIDRLLNQVDRNTNVADRTVSLVEKGAIRR
jgi:hypothetical protein